MVGQAFTQTTPPMTELSARLFWKANTEPDLAGYKLYWGTSPGNYDSSVTLGAVTSHKITGLTEHLTYFFALSAYDTSGNESGKSAEASKTIILISVDTTAPGVPSLGTTIIITIE